MNVKLLVRIHKHYIQKNISNYAFIDSQNLNLSIKELGWYLDFNKLYIYLKDKFKISTIFLFIGYIKGNEYLYSKLQSYGYILIFKPTLQDKGRIKGNCDAELVLHCMIHYDNFSQAVIISGDGDFHCLIKHLYKNKKLLGIGIPNKKKYSSLLRKFSNYFFFISDLKNKLHQKSEHSGRHSHLR